MGKFKRNTPFKKGRGKCVFCSNGSLSKQHMWPDWIKKILPRIETSHSQYLTRFSMHTGNAVLLQPEFQQHRGNIGARKIRNVCRTCNSGWMSRIEEKAKPTLTKLILGEDIELTITDQILVSTWATLMAIIAEYTDISTLSISENDRQWIMNNSKPPHEWKIWLGRYSGNEWKIRYRHHGLAAVQLPFLGNRNVPCNTQTTTIVAGNMFMHMQSTSVKSINLGFPSGRLYNLVPIWPNPLSTVRFPLIEINDGEAKSISDDFYHNAISRGFH